MELANEILKAITLVLVSSYLIFEVRDRAIENGLFNSGGGTDATYNKKDCIDFLKQLREHFNSIKDNVSSDIDSSEDADLIIQMREIMPEVDDVIDNFSESRYVDLINKLTLSGLLVIQEDDGMDDGEDGYDE